MVVFPGKLSQMCDVALEFSLTVVWAVLSPRHELPLSLHQDVRFTLFVRVDLLPMRRKA